MPNLSSFTRLFTGRRALIGVVHLEPLPGAPRSKRPLAVIRQAAERDARAYLGNGCDAVIVENFGDAPFFRDAVPAEVVAMMTGICVAVKAAAGGKPVGVNVLRNAARDALAVAIGAELAFIRVNVLASVAVADQGILEGDAARLLRVRRALAPDVAILADLRVKHAAPLRSADPAIEVEELAERALADAILVTGATTGRAVDPAWLGAVSAAAKRTPVIVASGVSASNVADCATAHGFVVGSSLKRGGKIDRPVDPARVRELRRAVDGLPRLTPR
jgi:uncharacterized protein